MLNKAVPRRKFHNLETPENMILIRRLERLKNNLIRLPTVSANITEATFPTTLFKNEFDIFISSSHHLTRKFKRPPTLVNSGAPCALYLIRLPAAGLTMPLPPSLYNARSLKLVPALVAPLAPSPNAPLPNLNAAPTIVKSPASRANIPMPSASNPNDESRLISFTISLPANNTPLNVRVISRIMSSNLFAISSCESPCTTTFPSTKSANVAVSVADNLESASLNSSLSVRALSDNAMFKSSNNRRVRCKGAPNSSTTLTNCVVSLIPAALANAVNSSAVLSDSSASIEFKSPPRLTRFNRSSLTPRVMLSVKRPVRNCLWKSSIRPSVRVTRSPATPACSNADRSISVDLADNPSSLLRLFKSSNVDRSWFNCPMSTLKPIKPAPSAAIREVNASTLRLICLCWFLMRF